jgi:pimeloyl-ACP methyl ester carboxylesterase
LARSSFDVAERFVEADGFRTRYLEAGNGPLLVYFHTAGGLRLSRAHELLAEHFRVVAFEVPGFSGPPSQRCQSHADIGATLVRAAGRLGLQRFNLWGTSWSSTSISTLTRADTRGLHQSTRRQSSAPKRWPAS